MKLLILTISVIGFMSLTNFVFTQESPEKIAFYNLEQELRGIYQFQMIGVRTKPYITNEILTEIKARQEQSSNVYYTINPTIRVLILSKDNVSQGTVIPDDELITYLNN